MKYSDLQNKDPKELQSMLKESQIQLGKFRFQLADKTLKDYSQVRKTKKDIARILTITKFKSKVK